MSSAPGTTPKAMMERSRAILDHLIREREQLHARGADAAALEANRIAIAYWQQRLMRRSSVRTAPPD